MESSTILSLGKKTIFFCLLKSLYFVFYPRFSFWLKYLYYQYDDIVLVIFSCIMQIIYFMSHIQYISKSCWFCPQSVLNPTIYDYLISKSPQLPPGSQQEFLIGLLAFSQASESLLFAKK